MSVNKRCPSGQECCFDLSNTWVGCYDPAVCQGCDRAAGKIIDDTDKQKTNCFKCQYDPITKTYSSVSTCLTWEGCCFGTCFDPICEECNQTTKTVVSKNNCNCCRPSTPQGTPTGPGVCLEKCQKCVNGEPKPKCDTSDAPNCCPAGTCYHPHCYDCTTGNLCGANEYCCGDCGCCTQCEKCQNGQKIDISDNVGPCEECRDGIIKRKCNTSTQGCCGGDTCYDYGCEDCINSYVYNNCDSRPDGKTLCCAGSCRDPYEDRCMACKNNVWTPKCPPDNNPTLKGCCNGTCFDTECSMCDNGTTVVSKNEAGKTCCVTKSGSNIYTETSNCCNGILLGSGEICCNNTIVDSQGGNYECCGNQPINTFISGCCYNTEFNKETHFCCNDNIYSYAHWKNGCCNGQPIDEYQGCCDGQPYYSKCYKCDNNEIIPIFDDGCFECNRLFGPESICGRNEQCCSIWEKDGDALGTCYDKSAKTCYECDEQTGVVKPTCDDPNQPDCCYNPVTTGYVCWNSKADLCQICDNGEIKDKCAGNSRWPGGKSSCCKDTGECFNQDCETCSPPTNKCATPGGGNYSNVSGNLGTQAGWLGGCCYNPNTGTAQCYNISCETCSGGIVRPSPNCKFCCNGYCCNTECCQLDSGEYKCCPDNTICIGGKCCPKDQVCNSGCCPDGEFCSQDGISIKCCKADTYNCNGECIEKHIVCCGVAPARDKCSPNQNCCNNTCHDVCCNGQPCVSGQICCGTQCANPTECCGGTIVPPSSCKECINGTSIDICPTVNGTKLTCCVGTNGQSGGCADPSKCESCDSATGAVIPYTPTRNDCYCVNGTRYCDCSNTPVSWILSEGYLTEYCSGVNYGNGGLSLLTPSVNDTWVYDGMPLAFNSNYYYAGNMSIYVTCSDGTRVGTFFFTSRSSTNPHPLPQTIMNPCCDTDRLPPCNFSPYYP